MLIKQLSSSIIYIYFMHIEQEIGLEVRHTLGRGSFATVYYCVDLRTQNAYAVKIFYKQDFTKQKLRGFRKEAEILESIEHQNVVKFHSFRQTENCLYLLMEYVPGGTLREITKKRWDEGLDFTDEEISKIMKSILSGIQYLHKYNIIHRDLKLENILVADPGDLSSIKIVDFGLSAQIDATNPKNVKAQCGTLLYMAPQILFQPSYSKAVDIWSCAVIMYKLYEGHHPFYQNGMTTEQYKQKLKMCEFPQLKNPLAQNFISHLSKVEYTQRYSVNEALQHPWITRNEQDEIPLSVNQSIHSFSTYNFLSDAFKFMFYVSQISKKGHRVPEEYRSKVMKVAEHSDKIRSNSTSYRKMSRRTKEVFLKIRQIINQKGIEIIKEETDFAYQQISSPLLRKHNQLFSKLFQKNKEESIENKPLLYLREIPVSVEKMSQTQIFSIKESDAFSNECTIEHDNSYSPKRSPSRNQQLTFDIGLEIMKASDEKKDKKLLKKTYSLREDPPSKFDTKQANARKTIQKKISFETKLMANRSRSRKPDGRISLERGWELQKFSPKKPQTAEIGKKTNRNAIRPMVFGGKSGMC